MSPLILMALLSHDSSYREIENIVLTENLAINGLKGSDDIAGGEITFDREENPMTQILGRPCPPPA